MMAGITDPAQIVMLAVMIIITSCNVSAYRFCSAGLASCNCNVTSCQL